MIRRRREILAALRILALLLVLFAALPALAQEPMRFDVPDPRPPAAKHWLDQPFLFALADSGKLTAQQREKQASGRLDRIVKASGATAREAWVQQAMGITAVMVGDEVLLTVLPEDLPEFYPQAPPELQQDLERRLAEKWRDVVQEYLDYQAGIRSDTRDMAWWLILTFTALGVALHIVVNRVAARFFRSPAWSVKALIWTFWLTFVLICYPSGFWFGVLLEQVLLEPLVALLPVWLGGLVLYAVAAWLVRRYQDELARLRGETGERAERRQATLRDGILFLIRFALFIAGAAIVLSGAGFNLGFLFTGAGLIGLMIGWVGKDLFQDLILGANILLEDHYGVGDEIDAGFVKGTVEAFTLRSTWIRGADGGLTTVPNSDMRRTVNYSREWCQADVRVTAPFAADAGRAEGAIPIERALREEAEALFRERPDLVTDPPRFLGVEELGRDSATFRVLLRTPATRHRDAHRELNERMLRRLQAPAGTVRVLEALTP